MVCGQGHAISYKLPALWGAKEMPLSHQRCDEDVMEQRQCEEWKTGVLDGRTNTLL